MASDPGLCCLLMSHKNACLLWFKAEFYVTKSAKVCYRDVNFQRHNTRKITVQKYIVEENVEFH